nr:MYB36 transcription factor protein [Fagopyrum tataricum]
MIAKHIPGKTDVQCLHRWQKVLDPSLVKGSWSKEEDERIIQLAKEQGINKKWSAIAKSLPGRIGKQCRERWVNHLDPAIKRDAWTAQEESILVHCQKIYGNQWAKITTFLPGRSDNAIKNHWNCSLKKRLSSYVLPIANVDIYRTAYGICDSAANSTEVEAMVYESVPVDCELRLHSGAESTSQEDAPMMSNTNSGSPIRFREAMSTGIDTSSQNLDGSFLSLSSCHPLEDDAQSKTKKDHQTSPILEQSEVEVLEIAEARVPNTKNDIIEQISSPGYFSSPELILRNSALSFPTPNIIRKKRRYEADSSLDACADTPPSLTSCYFPDCKSAKKQESVVTRFPELSRRLFPEVAYEKLEP